MRSARTKAKLRDDPRPLANVYWGWECDPVCQIDHEPVGHVGRPLADYEWRNQFCVFVEREPEILVADPGVALFTVMDSALHFANERPLLIAREVAEFTATHLRVEKIMARLPEPNHEPHGNLRLDAGDALDRPQG
jgi:hypothetical protein